MRQMAMAVVLTLLSTAALADGLRSDKHFVKIDVQPAGSSRQYNVQVFDAESRNHVAHLKVATKGDTPSEAETTAGSTSYKVRIEPHGDAYLIAFTAADAEGVIDTMRGGFTTVTKAQPEHAPPAHAGHDVDEPAVLRRVDAVYTEDARAAGAAGTVIVEVLIDRSGFVREATVVKPMGYGLSESAVDAVKQWRFEPSKQGHVPVEVTHEVTIEFKP